MAGTVLLTAANSSLGVPAVEHLLSTYPDYSAILTVRDASDSNVTTSRLRAVVARFPNVKVTIRALDLTDLGAVHEFADSIASEITNGETPPLAAIIANAYYWNLIGDPEITADGFDKSFQVGHIAHAALILRLLGSMTSNGRILIQSSDAHWPKRNPMETYPPDISNLDELTNPVVSDDKAGRGYHRYANTKLAMTTWMYPLQRYLQKQPSLSKITVITVAPGGLYDSRAMFWNTPVSMHRMNTYFLTPFAPIIRWLFMPILRTSAEAGVDTINLAVSSKYAGKTAQYYTMHDEDVSCPDSLDETKQERLWKQTLTWARITKENTALQSGF